METTCLTTFTNSYQAKILQDVLANEGIESFIENEVFSSVFPLQSFALELFVFKEDYERAKDLLKNAFPDLAKE